MTINNYLQKLLLFLKNNLNIFSTILTAIATLLMAVFTKKHYKMHYDSELTGFVKKFNKIPIKDEEGGQPANLDKEHYTLLSCSLINSGSVPVTVMKISFSIFDQNNKKLKENESVKSFYLEKKKKQKKCSLPLVLKGKEYKTLVFGIIKNNEGDIIANFAINKNQGKNFKVIIEIYYLVYKKFKKLLLNYNLEKVL